MTMKTYTVTLRDGSTDSRKSARPYTHAITVEYTQQHRDQVLAKHTAEIVALEALIAAHTARAATAEDQEAYAKASARHTYLNEYVTVTGKRNDGSEYTHETPRWLSDEFKVPDAKFLWDRRTGRDELDKVDNAIRATAQGVINRAQADIELTQAAIARAEERIIIGKCWVEGWSMSPHNALKLGQKVRTAGAFIGCRVEITTDISVKEHGTRAKKASPGAAEVR